MPPMERSFPADTLKAFRAWLGLSQEDVASILGISTRSVQTYEGHGGPEWMRYALLGWAVLVHGVTPRAASRKLGLPWEHHPLPGTAADDLDAGQFGEPPRRSAGDDDELDAELDDEADVGDAASIDGSAVDDADALIVRRERQR